MPPTSGARDAIPPLLLRAANRQLAKLKPISIRCQYRVNSIPWMEVVLSADDQDPGNHDDEVDLCQPGNAFRVATESGSLLLDGLVTRLSRHTTASRSELTVIVRHPLQRLASSHRSQVFQQLSDAAIVSAILNGHGVRTSGSSGLSIGHPQMVQFESSDWHFVLARLRANGVWLIPLADSLRIGPPQLGARADHVLRGAERDAGDGTEIDDASWRFDIAELASGIELSGWDARQQKSASVKAEATPLGRDALDPKRLQTLDAAVWSSARSTSLEPGEMAALAKARLQDQHLACVTARFVVAGSLAYAPVTSTDTRIDTLSTGERTRARGG